MNTIKQIAFILTFIALPNGCKINFKLRINAWQGKN
jgi:hypothetical protein